MPTNSRAPAPDPPRFLADRMLIRLARWLRAAGYDAEIDRHDKTDRVLVERAVAENRWLLTADRKMLEIKRAEKAVILLPNSDTEAAAAALSEKITVNWLLNPLSRCLICNQALESPKKDEIGAGSVPNNAPPPIRRCLACGRFYWRGGHAERMLAKLERWQAGDFA